MSAMRQRWPAVKVSLLLLYLGVLPPAPDASSLLAGVVLALVLLAAAPLFLQMATALPRCLRADDRGTPHFSAGRSTRLFVLPAAPGSPGTTRSRAPSVSSAAVR